MNRPATIADVAAAAGVSTGTVSLALNGKGRVSSETRGRVRRVAEELNYRPSVRARRLRGGRTHTVALLTTIPDAVVGGSSGLSFLLELALPLSRQLLERGYSMLLLPPLPEEKQTEYLANIDVDGVVVIDPLRDDPLCAELRARGIAVVTVGDVPGLDVDGVVSRGFSGADVSLRHLVARGARQILVIVSSEENSVSTSVRRYVEQCRKGGELPAGVEIIMADAPVGDGEGGGYRVARQQLSGPSGERIDAVYAPTDAVAVGVLRAAAELGRGVPGDLLVCTNFNGPRARGSNPPVTALELDLAALAREAAAMVVNCQDDRTSRSDRDGGGGDSGGPRMVEVAPPRLVERESTRR